MKRRSLTTQNFSAFLMTFAVCTVVSVCLVRDVDASANAPKARRNQKNSSSEPSETPESLMNSETTSRQEILAEVGETVYIGCPLQNKTNSYDCEWYKKNPQGGTKKRITQFFDRYQRLASCYLQIRSVTYDDEGTILCRAISDSSESTFHPNQLTVTGQDDPFGNKLPKSGTDNSRPSLPFAEPVIAKELSVENELHKVHKGDNFLLKCEATGNPKPLVSWRRGSRNYTSHTEGYSLLKLSNLTKDDSADYICEAINIFGKAEHKVTLEVKGELQGASEIIEVTPRNVTLYEGNQGNITCIARFEGDPWFGWVKRIENGTSEINVITYEGYYYSVLNRTDIRPLGQHLYSTTLLLQNVTLGNTGVYHCIVAGLQGYNHSEVYVVVEKDPTNLHIAQIGKHKTVVILWILSFVIFASLVIMCIFRVYGCPNAAANKALSSSQGSAPSDTSTSRKTQLPKRSPETLSTDCTGPRHDVLVPLVTHGSCSLTSQEPSLLHKVCTSSCRTYNSYDPEFSSHPSNIGDSVLMTNTNAARSDCSHNNAESCESEICSRHPRTQTSDYYTTHQLKISRYRSPRSHPQHHHKHCHQHHHLYPVASENHQQQQALHFHPPDSRSCSCTPAADYCSCHTPSYDDYPHSSSNLYISSDSESQWYPDRAKSPQYHHHHHHHLQHPLHGEHCHSYYLDDSGRLSRATNERRKLNPSPNLSFLEQLAANPNTITAFI